MTSSGPLPGWIGGYGLNPASRKLKYPFFATMISSEAISMAMCGWIVNQVAVSRNT
jgi:hypothetical protein